MLHEAKPRNVKTEMNHFSSIFNSFARSSSARWSEFWNPVKSYHFRENELFSKRGCHSIVPHLLFGEFANLKHLFDKCHPAIVRKALKRAEITTSSLHFAFAFARTNAAKNPALPISSTNLFVNHSRFIKPAKRLTFTKPISKITSV
jgi:hypothetical protein